MNKNAIFDVNSQKGMMDNIDIVYAIGDLIEYSAGKITITGSVFSNNINGDNKYDETIVKDNTSYYLVPNNRYGIDIELANNCDQVYFEYTNCMDSNSRDMFGETCGQPDNIMTYLRYMQTDNIFLIGSNKLNYLTDAAVGLVKCGFNVYIVEDLVDTDIPFDSSYRYTSMLHNMGVEFVDSDYLIGVIDG